jgi:hypothetical protein
MSRRNSAPNAALEAIAAAPQPSFPASARVFPERRGEPHEVENIQARQRRRDQNPGAIAVVEPVERFGRRTDSRELSVDEAGDDEEDDELNAGTAPQALPEGRGGVSAGGRGYGGCAHANLLWDSRGVYAWVVRSSPMSFSMRPLAGRAP